MVTFDGNSQEVFLHSLSDILSPIIRQKVGGVVNNRIPQLLLRSDQWESQCDYICSAGYNQTFSRYYGRQKKNGFTCLVRHTVLQSYEYSIFRICIPFSQCPRAAILPPTGWVINRVDFVPNPNCLFNQNNTENYNSNFKLE